ncbi:hypothetical protein [Azospirillum doebereinerae]|uniref:Uncharacterized protein n=1 Tax=Azospirillum doebereinerae TaxID=92933 RepID=A0A3S0WWI7_9PROT|nr:hypothetical protein [Azospirillum doebereinerae]RUQ74035.1 hypothetical protein EJ913_06605 [Azospirillum doebereinerae]
MTTDQPPFARHHRTAQALVSTFQEALEPQFSAKGALSREDFTRAMNLMMAHWPTVLPLFASICQSCTQAAGCREGAGCGGGCVPRAVFKPDGRRRDFVTRLLFSTVRMKVPEIVDPISGAVFPQIIAGGLQTSLNGLFYDKEWEALNADAIAIYNHLGTDQDAEVWKRIAGQDTLAVLTDTLFVRVMLRFRQFHQQRQTFTRRMTDLLRDKRFVFADGHFETLFDTLFGRLREGLRTELDRARLDIHYGEGTADALMRIFDQFDKHRLEQSLPVRVLGGRSASRPMLAQRSMLGATPAAKRR